MLEHKKVIVVMPAYNAGSTLGKTVAALSDIVDEIIVVDDCSHDDTILKAEELGLTTIRHPKNLGYGGNQKTCYKVALEHGADVVVMVHPDYQYEPSLVGAMAAMIASGQYDLVLGSRVLGDQRSRKEAMPRWRYIANRFLTLFQNVALGYKLTEYHTGFRAFSREFLATVDRSKNSNNFLFDNEFIAQAIFHGYKIGEISCPTRYTNESSSISFVSSVHYGLGVIATCIKYLFSKSGLYTFSLFSKKGH
jgi:glycosyltransferase involved in cell wall biosynthesis